MLEGDGDPSPEALAAAACWFRRSCLGAYDALRRLAGPSPLPSGRTASPRCSITRARGVGRRRAGRGARPRERRAATPRSSRTATRRERRCATRSCSASTTSGEAADLERGTARAPIGDDPSVTVGLPRALEALAALDLRATFFVEGLNAELYPQALRDIAAAGHEVGLHGWRHEVWDALSPRRGGRAPGPRRRARSRASASRSRASVRPAADSGRGRSRPWPRTGCAGARPRASARGARPASRACPSAGRRSTPTTDSSPSPTGARLGATGRTSPRRARPPMRSSAPSTREATTRSSSSCTRSSCSRSPRRRRRAGCSSTWPGWWRAASAGWRRAASSRRWWATGLRARLTAVRLAALARAPAGSASNVGPAPS